MQFPHASGMTTYPALRPIARTVLAALLFAAFGIGAGFAVRTIASDPSSGPVQLGSLIERAGPLVVYAEFGETEDIIWAANPAKPSERTQLGLIPHAMGYGIAPRVSPDGSSIAYTVAPPSGGPAELWVLEIEAAQARRLAAGIDLASAPVWSATSDALIARRSTGTEDGASSAELLRVDLAGNVSTLVSSHSALYAIGLSPDGTWLYYATLSEAGTDLARVTLAGGEPESIAHLSDGIARDWQLSPDGSKLAYLTQSDGGYAVSVLDLATGAAVEAAGAGARQEFNPIWSPNGDLTIGRLEGAALRLSGVSTAGAAELAAPDKGFDVPIAWAPDGDHLTVRAFEGDSTNDPGPSRVVVVGADGERTALSSISDVTIAGWLAP